MLWQELLNVRRSYNRFHCNMVLHIVENGVIGGLGDNFNG